MKKVLSTVAALGMIAGYAATASAVDVKLSGAYEVDGIYYNYGTGSGVNVVKSTPEANGDAYLMHSANVKAVLKANDKTKLVADFWLTDDSIWGKQEDLITTNGQGFEVHKLFMEYKSPVGKFRVGRTLAGPWGLDFFNNESHANRIMWWPSFAKTGPLTTLLFYQKTNEGDGDTTADDRDQDYYEARFYVKGAPGQSIFTLAYDRNAFVAGDLTTQIKLKACGDYTFNNVYVKAEVEYQTGETEDRTAATPDVDIARLGFFADVGVKMDKMDVGGMFFYASGDDNGTTDNERSNFMSTGKGLGEDFEPLYILTGYTTGLLNGGKNAADTNMRNAGVMAIVAHADFGMTDAMSMNAAVGWAVAADEPAAYLDDEYGIEINAGMSYKLLDNLTYDLHLGYLMTGDFFNGASAVADVEDIILATHHLTMEF